MKSSIKAISYYLPEYKLTNDELSSEFPEWSVQKISEKTGIYNRYISAPEVCSSDLGIESAKKLFSEHNVDPKDIDFMMLCTQSPDYFLPTSACVMQNKLGIPTTAGALDFNLGCSGFVYGLSLARGLVESGDAKNVLLITAETYSKFMHPKDKSCRTIFGDAASAILISASEDGSIGPFVFGTDGRGAENLIVKTGGMRNLRTSETAKDITDENGNVTNADSLYMNGIEIFNFTLKTIPPLIANIYQKSGLTDNDVDLYIFHQANKYMLNTLRTKLKLSPDKFYLYMEDCGNTVSSTIPIAMYHAIKEGRVKKGSRLMLVGFGVGYSWAGCIVEL